MTPNTSAHPSVDGREVTEDAPADAFLVEWQQGGETWVQAHADEPTAVDQAKRKGGTCTPLFRLTSTAALQERIADLEAALKPFAAKAEQFSQQPDGLAVVQMDFAHFRHARATLTKGATA